jgi:N-acyl-D-aspartate/D-glutamate deacylase
MPVQVPMNMSFLNYCALFMLPGWSEVMGLLPAERMAKLRDPTVRKWMAERADTPEAGVFRRLTAWGDYVIGDTYSLANAALKERRVSDIAAERGTSNFDTLLDIVLADDLRTILWPIPTDGDPASWQLRSQVWNDDRAMIGGSDAGAHLDRMCGAPYTTRFIGDVLRGRKLTTLEHAVKLITDDPAQLFGLRDRGRIAEGYRADLVLFDPETIAAEHATLVADLPGGATRLTAEARGVVRVWVNGVETVRDNAPTGALPGVVLRSGRDTRTPSL